MKQYTQEEFDSFEIINGRKQCPTGDYSLIKDFPAFCIFGENCSFDECCSFGECCHFGEGCRFGEWCRFGEGCSLDERCRFGEGCRFGEWCMYCLFEFNKLINLNSLYTFPVRIYLNTELKRRLRYQLQPNLQSKSNTVLE